MESSYKLDKTDLEIVRNLWDGRTPYSDIAEKIGLTTNTVRNRVNKLLDKGVLQIISLVEPTAIAGHHSAFVGFNILPADGKNLSDPDIRVKRYCRRYPCSRAF